MECDNQTDLGGIFRPDIDAKIVEVFVGVSIGLPFGDTLEFRMALAFESELSS